MDVSACLEDDVRMRTSYLNPPRIATQLQVALCPRDTLQFTKRVVHVFS